MLLSDVAIAWSRAFSDVLTSFLETRYVVLMCEYYSQKYDSIFFSRILRPKSRLIDSSPFVGTINGNGESM